VWQRDAEVETGRSSAREKGRVRVEVRDEETQRDRSETQKAKRQLRQMRHQRSRNGKMGDVGGVI
jgi:hypothetical protein